MKEENNIVDDMTIISLKRTTQQVLKRMCESEGRTYTSMINTLIDYWNEVKE
jgi:hypothetical protein